MKALVQHGQMGLNVGLAGGPAYCQRLKTGCGPCIQGMHLYAG